MTADTEMITVERDELHELLVYLTAADELLCALNWNTDPPACDTPRRLMQVVEDAFNRFHFDNAKFVDDEPWNRAFAAVRLDAHDVAANMIDELLADEQLGLAVLFDGDGHAAWPTVRCRLRERRDDLRTWADEERERRDGVIDSGVRSEIDHPSESGAETFLERKIRAEVTRQLATLARVDEADR